MKTFLALYFAVAVSVSAQTPTPTVASVENLDAIQLIDGNGAWSAPRALQELWANTTLRTPLRLMLRTKLAWYAPLDAKEYMNQINARGIAIPQADIDALNARIDTLRQQKESALMTVKDTNPQRALTKMQDLLARGLPITQATQNAVNAAAGVSPTPVPTPAPTPTPEPNDGL